MRRHGIYHVSMYGKLPPHHFTLYQGQTRRTQKSRSTTTKFKVRSKMMHGSDHKGNPTGKRRGTAPKPRKTDQYELRVKELETEMEMRAQRRNFCWKKRQQRQRKLQENTEVLDVSDFLQKRVQKDIRTGKTRTNTKKSTSNKAMKTPVGTTSTSEVKNLSTFCIEKRQQTT